MTGWLRKDSIRLGEMAMQAGLRDLSEAEHALELGARFMAHRFSGAEIDDMIRTQYRRRAEDPRAALTPTKENPDA